MRQPYLVLLPLLCSSLLVACGSESSSGPAFADKAALGEALFQDVNLSFERTQSCATCHNPQQAFVDNRRGADDLVHPVSLGDNGVAFGDRNTPSAAYALFSPLFSEGSRSRINKQDLPEALQTYSGYLGGQFWDGRASTLAAQAAGPPLNPLEMGMPNKTSVVERLRENSAYTEAFKRLYSATLFDDVDAAYAAMTDSIATFEKSAAFAPFDSKYDRSLLSETAADYFNYTPPNKTLKAALGRDLFFSQFLNCAGCHQLKTDGSKKELFTSYEYHNIGVPKNSAARLLNGLGEEHVDNGLKNNNAAASDETAAGKFKVPSLRNVAVTGPYMHNGVFQNLDTVIKFYDSKLPNSSFTFNPETGVEWAAPEVAANISAADLGQGQTLTQDDVDALVCFLRTLTDKRYEDLLPDDGLCD